eukprot:SAG11_NODE_1004_length_6210_cov_14.226150_7_plen_81_part_00
MKCSFLRSEFLASSLVSSQPPSPSNTRYAISSPVPHLRAAIACDRAPFTALRTVCDVREPAERLLILLGPTRRAVSAAGR